MNLIALLFCPFAFTTGAFVFSGVLQPMAASLGVSVAAVATLQSVFAIACALCGPVLAHMTRRLPPRTLLLGVLLLLTILNAASALAGDFRTLFVLRLLVGGIGSLSFPLATMLAVSGTTAEGRPKAISTVYAGIPMALIVGIPLGSVTGNAFGWQASFVAVAAICAIAVVLVAAFVREGAGPVPGAAQGAAPRFGSAIFTHLGVTLIASTALFSMVGLIGPIIRATTGFSGTGIAAVQFLAGLSSLVGVRLGSALVARDVRYGLVVPFALLLVSLGIVVSPLVGGVVTVVTILAMIASVSLGPAAQSATGTLVQARLAEMAGSAARLAFSLNGSMIYLGQGLGIVLGAAAFEQWGLGAAPATGLILTLPGIALALHVARALKNSPTQTEN
ncbi:MFS transporter [Breoghania sp.]|uniref:MFS transporter n=1 Tax=Breoghania sp. TaxID=2065378 RepID=UPI002AA5F7CF|nr:MFS transporter [Breoghania sp.]